MVTLVRGALIEYGVEFSGPIPNIVVFQFNPEKITRSLAIPSRTSRSIENARQTENRQTGSPPTESFSITAYFSAADSLALDDTGSSVARLSGVAPQLVALEKMVYPVTGLVGIIAGAVVDAIASSLSNSGNRNPVPVPRQQLPRILFIWGGSRVLPVVITSMSIAEEKYDNLLNPVQAKVTIGLEVITFPNNSDDTIGIGALFYTQTIKELQATGVAELQPASVTGIAASAIDTISF